MGREGVMSQFVRVGTRGEFEGLKAGKLVQAGKHRIAMFNIGGSHYAIEDTCPHRGGPLSDGNVASDEVICPWHGSRFDIKTGAVVSPPARQGVKSFPIRIAGDGVEVEIE
jgi:3-phenylpropionate/trans-cinnamate dioxygenase ferredoxin subunit